MACNSLCSLTKLHSSSFTLCPLSFSLYQWKWHSVEMRSRRRFRWPVFFFYFNCLLQCQFKIRKRLADIMLVGCSAKRGIFQPHSDLSVVVYTRWHVSVLLEMLKRGDGSRFAWPDCVFVSPCICALLPLGHPGPSLVTTQLPLLAIPKISPTTLLIACLKRWSHQWLFLIRSPPRPRVPIWS